MKYFCNYDGISLIFKQLWNILMTTLNFIQVDKAMWVKTGNNADHRTSEPKLYEKCFALNY